MFTSIKESMIRGQNQQCYDGWNLMKYFMKVDIDCSIQQTWPSWIFCFPYRTDENAYFKEKIRFALKSLKYWRLPHRWEPGGHMSEPLKQFLSNFLSPPLTSSSAWPSSPHLSIIMPIMSIIIIIPTTVIRIGWQGASPGRGLACLCRQYTSLASGHSALVHLVPLQLCTYYINKCQYACQQVNIRQFSTHSTPKFTGALCTL